MKAIILAAGRGSRMGSLTNDQPKCLTVVNGKPLIEHQIEALTKAGIHDIAIVTGYKSETLQKYGTHHFHNDKWHETNMFYSLMCAREWLDNDDCIVSYSDIYYDAQIIKDLIICSDKIAVAYDPNWLELWSRRFGNPLDDAETFRIDDNGCITEIGQKPKTVKEIQGQYMGLLKFSKEVWKLSVFMQSNLEHNSYITDFLQYLIRSDISINAVKNEHAWFEFDNLNDLHIGQSFLKGN